MSADDVVARVGVDAERGLDPDEVQRRLAEFGRNEIATEPPPTLWEVAKGQLANPMNIMLLIVSIASFAIGQVATGVIVLALVSFNVIMGTSQERKAMASVEALAQLQVPKARVRRSGSVEEVDSTGLVPGDVVLIEAGELVPADARIVTSASLEVQEASLTGESAPIAKDATTLPEGETALGDRTNLVFQNTQVTRGSAAVVVVATGAATQMGHIADMVTATKRTKSPLQRELDGLTKLFGILAWAAVAVIAIFGIARGQDGETLVLLCVSTAISAIPTGLPTFVQLMLSSGAQRLAEAKAVVKSLTDVETLGGTTVINSDKTGTPDDERHDGDDDVDRRRLVQDRRRRLQEVRRHPRHRGRPDTRLHPSWRSGSCCAATPPSPTTSRSSATRPRPRWSCSPPRSVSTPRRPAGPCPGARRCRSTPSTSSWRRSTTAPTGSPGASSTNPTSSA